MKTRLLIILLSGVVILTCTPSTATDEKAYRLIPDRTPFISGIVEASLDTTHYYTQVVVGYATDSRFVDNYEEIQHIPMLFSPTHWSQVVRTLQRFMLAYEVEDEAQVQIIGPLFHESEKKVELESEGFGVYGDLKSELLLQAGEQYSLEVNLPNGATYSATTFIPEQTNIEIPDSVGLHLTLKHYDDGVPYERSDNYEWLKFQYPQEAFITETQKNTNIDWELLFLDKNESFLFEDRSEYLRTGINYAIWRTGKVSDSTNIIWSRTLNQSWVKEKPFKKEWRRFAFYSDGMWRNHQTLNEQYSGRGDYWEQMDHEFVQAAQNRDSTFLFKVSTLQKINEHGEVLPHDSLDAIGFFAGNFSVYKKLVVYPIRNYDIDSVYKTQGF